MTKYSLKHAFFTSPGVIEVWFAAPESEDLVLSVGGGIQEYCSDEAFRIQEYYSEEAIMSIVRLR